MHHSNNIISSPREDPVLIQHVDIIQATFADHLQSLAFYTDWRTLPSRAIQNNDGQLMGATSAYTMELLAISLALRLHELLGVKASLHSGSSVSINYVKGGIGILRRSQSTHRLLVQSAVTIVNSIESEPLWVRGHPERRKTDKDTWTPAEWGNHLVDRAADTD